MAKRLKPAAKVVKACLLYTSDAAADFLLVGEDASAAESLRLSPVAKSGKFIRYSVDGNISREDAEELVGKLIFAPADDDEVLPEDVIGFLVVTAEGEPVGVLTDIMQMPGQDVYAIDSGKKEILIPAVPEIVRQINFDSETITITPMEGLLEL